MFLPKNIAHRVGPKWTYAAGAAVAVSATAAMFPRSPQEDVPSYKAEDEESSGPVSRFESSSNFSDVAVPLPHRKIMSTSVASPTSYSTGDLRHNFSALESDMDLTYGFIEDLIVARKTYLRKRKSLELNQQQQKEQHEVKSGLDEGIGSSTENVLTMNGDASSGKAVVLASSDSRPKSNLRMQPSVVSTKRMYVYNNSIIHPENADNFKLFCAPSSLHLAQDVANLLGVDLGNINVDKYNDGETSIKINEMVRGKQIYFLCSTETNDALMELLLSVSCMSRASAGKITVVIPYYGYSRQDRKVKRESIAASDVARMLEVMNVNRVITLDLHNDSIRGFFSPRVPVDHLLPGPIAAAYFNEVLDPSKHPEKQITVVATHEGQVQRATEFRRVLQKLSGVHVNMAFISKSRQLPSQTTYDPILVGDIKGHKCILIDDIISTGSTLTNAINLLKENGADNVYAYATHALFNDANTNVPDKLQALNALDFLLITNTVSSSKVLPSKIRTLTVAPYIAEAISRSLDDRSITAILKSLT
mmetsp:Transcript_3297/g.6083  ORF Transcript_3297/g.6083 Transcript_3297/m.6083 type:complete len:534 (-) Transcript_3297:99-1700(-)